MKGDFSRLGPRPDDTVTGVWLQQGRPLLDADWNDLQSVVRRMATRSVDAMLGGPAGPAEDLGFEVSAVARLALNIGGATGQRLAFDPSPSLPFGAAVVEERIEEEVDAVDAARSPVLVRLADEVVFHERGDRPYAVEVEAEAARGASGVLLRRPGHVAVGMRSDGSLWLAGGSGGAETTSFAPVGRRCRLTLVYDGRRYRLFADEELVAERQGIAEGEPQGPALTLGAEPDGSDALACRIDTVRIWRLRASRGRSVGRLVADLDLAAAEGRRVPDRTRSGNDARIDGERPPQATLGLRLGAGRYIVGGRPLVNPRPVPLDIDAAPMRRGVGLVYLAVGERAFGALEDPSLRETALGGVDTVIQSRAEWRADLVVGPDADAAWAAFRGRAEPGGGRAEFEHSPSPAGNGLYRAEVHDAGWCHVWPLGPRARAATVAVRTGSGGRLAWPADLPLPRPGAPLLASCDGAEPWVLRVAADASAGQVAVTGGPASWPTEEVRILPLASFKWSPNNAASACRVAGATAIHDADGGELGRVDLASVGFNGLDLARGDWVELSGDPDVGPGRLYPVADFDVGLLQVDLADWDDPPAGERRYLRRWGPPARRTVDGAYPAVLAAERSSLDPDVAIRFGPDARYDEGEAWTFPLRQAEDDSWQAPRRRAGWLAPEGPARVLVPLALVHFGEERRVEDLRRSFRDLPSLTAVVHRPAPPERPAPERRVDSAEAARWLSRHLPGARLLGTGAPPAGFRLAGHVVCREPPEATRWQGLPPNGRGPTGPGHAVSVGGGVIFVEEERTGAWRWTDQTRWMRLKNRPEARTGFSVVAVGGGVAVVGGTSVADGRPCETIDLFVPGDDWTRLACDATPALGSAAAMVGSFLYITGGFDEAGMPTARCDAVDLRTGRAFQARPMRLARAGHGLAARGEACWAVGGSIEGGRETAEVEAYDGVLDLWRSAAPLRGPVVGPSLAIAGSGVVAVGGGRRNRPLDEAALYDPDHDRWTALGQLPGGRRRLGLAAEPPGAAGELRLLAIAGEGGDGTDMVRMALSRRLDLWISEGDETWP